MFRLGKGALGSVWFGGGGGGGGFVFVGFLVCWFCVVLDLQHTFDV